MDKHFGTHTHTPHPVSSPGFCSNPYRSIQPFSSRFVELLRHTLNASVGTTHSGPQDPRGNSEVSASLYQANKDTLSTSQPLRERRSSKPKFRGLPEFTWPCWAIGKERHRVPCFLCFLHCGHHLGLYCLSYLLTCDLSPQGVRDRRGYSGLSLWTSAHFLLLSVYRTGVSLIPTLP